MHCKLLGPRLHNDGIFGNTFKQKKPVHASLKISVYTLKLEKPQYLCQALGGTVHSLKVEEDLQQGVATEVAAC